MSDNRMICENGHYYDGSRYTKCPHCAEGLARVEPSVFVTADNVRRESDKAGQKILNKKSIFSRKRKESTDITAPVTPISREVSNVALVEQTNLEGHDLTRGLRSMMHVMQDEEAMRRTMPVTAQGDIGSKVNDSSRPLSGVLSETPLSQEVVKQPMRDEDSVQSEQPPQALSDAFVQAITPRKSAIDKDKTVSFFSARGKTEPPVGYLICTAGDDFGCGFLLKTGNNAIGRGQAMDVVIMDPKVSREKQALVMYEPKNRRFFLKPGESSGLCYLNGEIVLSPVEIHPFDKVGMGDTELMLIVVCCEQFGWEDYE